MSLAVPKKHLFGRRWMLENDIQKPHAACSISNKTDVQGLDALHVEQSAQAPITLDYSSVPTLSQQTGSDLLRTTFSMNNNGFVNKPTASDDTNEELVDVDDDGKDFGDPRDILTKGSPLVCDVCGKQFLLAARLLRHQRVHTGEKPFNCEFCGKMFAVKENLNVHRRIHTKERPYSCEVCGRAFEHSGKLNRHMRIHTGERPHKCTLCKKAFVQSGQLVIHMRAHTGEKPYACETCGKAFTCSKQLKVHRRTHTGEKPYTCNICGKSFGYNHVLKTHKNSHFGQRMYKCTLCNETFTQRKLLEQHLVMHKVSYQTGILHNENETSQQNTGSHAIDFTTSAFRSVDALSSFPDGRQRPLSSSAAVASSFASQSTGDVAPQVYAGINTSDLTTCSPHIVTPRPLRYCWTLPAAPLPVVASFSAASPISVPSNEAFQPRGVPSAVHSSLPTTLLDWQIRQGWPEAPSSCPLGSPSLPTTSSTTDAVNTSVDTFIDKVTSIITHVVAGDSLKKLGFPQCDIGQALEAVLLSFGECPCRHAEHDAALARLKCNVHNLLMWCVPNARQWADHGWHAKNIDQIVHEFHAEFVGSGSAQQEKSLVGALNNSQMIAGHSRADHKHETNCAAVDTFKLDQDR